ncbi:MAG TPA: HAD family hydrolase [Pyrinomonadaceae bacterium]|nr:HAD family hydrolase [Pyrinomonadaceae bacterium]
MARLVLIDRDGTINVERHYLSSPEQIELFPETVAGIKLLRNLGFKIAVVTNQSAIGRGYFGIEKLGEIHNHLHNVLAQAGTEIDGIYFCPHIPDDDCQCRKPEIEMATNAAAEFEAELSKAFVIGDNVCDIELGKNVGATTILVQTGYGKRTLEEKRTTPDYVVGNLLEAANLIKEITEREITNV